MGRERIGERKEREKKGLERGGRKKGREENTKAEGLWMLIHFLRIRIQQFLPKPIWIQLPFNVDLEPAQKL